MTANNHDVLVGWSVNLSLAGAALAETTGWLIKIVSVFVLAIVAECGRQLVMKLWRKP